MKRRLILLGPPGAGKGTHAERLAADLDVPRVATGDMLRHEVEEDTELGRRARSFMEEGDLVPDELVVELAVSRLSRSDAANGWILDGFPRNADQARGLDDALEDRNVDLVVVLDVALDEIIDRLGGRCVCPQGHVYHVSRNPPRQKGICDEDGEKLFQRDDDSKDVIRHRVQIYAEETEPLLEIYEGRGLVRHLDGAGDPDDVYPRVLELLDDQASGRGRPSSADS